eukprot:Skav213416  [mRNA]  locus=scaffold38:24032:26359:- [translate_table: standard]
MLLSWHAGRRTRYWDTSVEYEDCEDHFLYVPRYNDYVALEPHRDPTCDPPLMCAIETNVWPAKVCSKFPANFKEAEAKEVSRQCYQKLCMLARSGKWKNGWGKQKAAKKTPWRARLQAEGHKSIGWHEAFEKECWHGPKVFGDLMPDFDAFVKEHDFNTTKGTFNKKAMPNKEKLAKKNASPSAGDGMMLLVPPSNKLRH